VYKLLFKNYVEDTDATFRFRYSVEFLRWACLPTVRYDGWVLGVRTIKNKKLVGFITAIPVHMMVNNNKN